MLDLFEQTLSKNYTNACKIALYKINSFEAIQCLHILIAEQLSLKPPRARLPKLLADTTAIMPYTILWLSFQLLVPINEAS